MKHPVSDEGDVDTKAACVAVAGPVRDSVATMTNLDWAIDRDTLARATSAQTVAILNDLQAQGHALGHLDSDKVRAVLPGQDAGPHAAKLVIGVGTGFNAAPVFDTAAGRLVPPSESGHANLPIRTEQELRLCQYVSNAHGFPAVEDVLSGRGLERVYGFLGQESSDPVEKSAKDIDPTAVRRCLSCRRRRARLCPVPERLRIRRCVPRQRPLCRLHEQFPCPCCRR